MPRRVLVVLPGEGKVIQRRYGQQTVTKVTAAETDGAYSVRENSMPAASAGVPLHIHREAEEAFYILEGVMTVYEGEQRMEAPAGSFVLIMRGTPHTLANWSNQPVRWLTFFSPGWVSNWVEEESDLLLASATGEIDPAQRAAIYEKFGMEIVGPPPKA